MYEEAVLGLMDAHLPTGSAPHDWDLSALDGALERDFNARVDIAGWLVLDPQLEEAALRDRAVKAVLEGYAHKVARIGEPIMRHIERDVVLRMLDQHWRDHLAAMDYLRQGIHLRGYRKVGRNEPCPCGSGRKFKQCHGALES